MRKFFPPKWIINLEWRNTWICDFEFFFCVSFYEILKNCFDLKLPMLPSQTKKKYALIHMKKLFFLIWFNCISIQECLVETRASSIDILKENALNGKNIWRLPPPGYHIRTTSWKAFLFSPQLCRSVRLFTSRLDTDADINPILISNSQLYRHCSQYSREINAHDKTQSPFFKKKKLYSNNVIFYIKQKNPKKKKNILEIYVDFVTFF